MVRGRLLAETLRNAAPGNRHGESSMLAVLGKREPPLHFYVRVGPSGDDPLTRGNDLNCTNVTALGGRGRGEAGNLCHKDCAGRGLCDYVLGECACFSGFEGSNCDKQNALFVVEVEK
jgi:hypothetical protein